jgi:LysM repeat protein
MQFKRLVTVLIMTAAFLAVLPLTVLATSGQADTTPQPATAETLGPNLLTNPGMEGQYVKQCSLRNSGQPWVQVSCPADYNSEVGDIKQWETTQVPYGWSAWWQQPNSNLDDPNYFNTYPNYCPEGQNRTPFECKAWHNPEYRDTLGGPQETGPERKVAGDNSQKYFTFYSVHEAGIYQVVGGVKPGDRLRFSVFMEGWSNGANDPSKSDYNQHMNLQVGIDPTGGNNPWSPNIVWTAPAESFDKFTQFVVEAVAKNNVVSVWTKSRPDMPLQHVDVYVDEASLNVVQGAAKPAKAVPAKTTRVITSTKVITNSRGITSTVIVTRTVVVTPVPAKPATSTRIVTSTKVITGSNGITSTVVTTRTVVVTPVATKPVTSTKPVSGTVGAKPPTTPVTGTLPIPASGTYTVVKGDSLSKIARRFGVSLATLIALNDIKDPDRIEAGMVLKLK